MSSTPSVTTWIGLLRSGDQAAAESLWRRYYAVLIELARAHLAKQLPPDVDAEDIALAAFTDFCRGAKAGRFPQLANREDLWKLLLTLTLRRARDAARRATRERRDYRRTVSAGELFDLPEADLDRLAGDAPDPALAAEVADELRFLLARLPGEDLRSVARELLAGYTAPEVALRLGCSLRTVERRWQRIRQFWQLPAEE